MVNYMSCIEEKGGKANTYDVLQNALDSGIALFNMTTNHSYRLILLVRIHE